MERWVSNKPFLLQVVGSAAFIVASACYFSLNTGIPPNKCNIHHTFEETMDGLIRYRDSVDLNRIGVNVREMATRSAWVGDPATTALILKDSDLPIEEQRRLLAIGYYSRGNYSREEAGRLTDPTDAETRSKRLKDANCDYEQGDELSKMNRNASG